MSNTTPSNDGGFIGDPNCMDEIGAEEVYADGVCEECGADLCEGKCPNCDCPNDEPWDGFHTDADADANVLASAGHGTDEDYGYYGGDE